VQIDKSPRGGSLGARAQCREQLSLHRRKFQPASPALRRKAMLRDFIRRRLFEPILALLRQGITPQKLPLSLAFDLGLGTLPVLALPTILRTLAAVSLRLNLAAIQLVNCLAAHLSFSSPAPSRR